MDYCDIDSQNEHLFLPYMFAIEREMFSFNQEDYSIMFNRLSNAKSILLTKWLDREQMPELSQKWWDYQRGYLDGLLLSEYKTRVSPAFSKFPTLMTADFDGYL